MKSSVPVLGVFLVAALTILSGVIHGRMSNRWGVPPDVLAAAKKLQGVPAKFGNWTLQSSEEMSDHVVKMLECAGYFVREYRYRDDEQPGREASVKVALLLGPSGPMSSHTPEICFKSQNYPIEGDRERLTVRGEDGSQGDFWAVTFKANDPAGDMIRVYYGWSTGGPWRAPENHRFAFASYPFLYKIQVASVVPLSTNLGSDDPCRAFLKDFVPAVKPYLKEAF
jgi:hypothetical protein